MKKVIPVSDTNTNGFPLNVWFTSNKVIPVSDTNTNGFPLNVWFTSNIVYTVLGRCSWRIEIEVNEIPKDNLKLFKPQDFHVKKETLNKIIGGGEKK